MSNKELLFYDVECFQYDSLVVFKTRDNQEVAHFWSLLPEDEYVNDWPNGFESVFEVIRGKTLVGFNNYNYDDIMLFMMLRGADQFYLKRLNDSIISGMDESFNRKCAHQEFKSLGCDSLDCMQQIDVSMPSLKKIEGNMGRSIIESDVPFDIDRPLTEEEKETVLAYCRYDIESTIAIYNIREEMYFQTKEQLIEMLRKDSARYWNTTTISANILMDRPARKWAHHEIPQELWRNVEGIPGDVWDMWENASYMNRDEKKPSITVRAFDCDITFGFGGLHGANIHLHEFSDVKLLDVASMYPSIIIKLNALGPGVEKYRSMRDERVSIKKTNPTKAQALKLILNSVYGNLKNKHSILYNPMAAVSVCIYGQVCLFDLCKSLAEAGYTIVNINTDGVAFVDMRGAGDEYMEIQSQWEEKYDLTLELDEFDYWIQKDVNNYVARHGEQIKTKGGECNKYQFENLFSNNDARIVQIALVEKLIFDTDPLKTITEHLDEPKLFQYVLKAGNTYKGVSDEKGNWQNKVNRVFAAKKDCGKEVTRLYKVRQDGGRVNFADAPETMYVFNGDLADLYGFSDIVDISHYYSLVMKKLEGWEHV